MNKTIKKEEDRNLPLSVITLGSATIDIVIKNNTNDIVIPCEQKQLANNISYSLGGGSLNAAFAFSLQNIFVQPMAVIGNDLWSDHINKTLDQNLINTDLLIKKNIQTRISTIFSTQSTKNSIVTHCNIKHAIQSSDINFDAIKNANMLYVSSINLNNPEDLITIVKHCNKYNTTVVINPGKHFLTTYKDILQKSLQCVDIFLCNKSELITFLQPTSIQQGIQQLHNFGVKTILVTCDKDGAYLSSNNQIKHQQAPLCNPINTTGAGDAFGATFAALVLKNNSIDFAFKQSFLAAHQVILSNSSHMQHSLSISL